MKDGQPRLYQNPDRIYASADSLVEEPFKFNQQVSEVFDDMALRSIPLYKELIQLTLSWSLSFYRSGTYLYDLGCATGTFIDLFCHNVQTNAQIVAIDSSEAMLQRAQEKVATQPDSIQIEFLQKRLQAIVFEPASVVVSNYTLQFLPVEDRLTVLARVAGKLMPNGILILSEKLKFQDPTWHELATGNYEQFKQQNGYSQREIERKKEALERVLVPLSLPEQIQMLRRAGFRRFQTLLAWQQFTTIVASV